ncbi:Glycosyl hydrolase family 81 [Legionella wadsworthii]|uniref:glucan endo-1,3-beta-D-glucosidase n=1 Tax=Legionella wadsworthii TaxID=28088 RepID=A0A378LQE6_9GAMM|nr:glycosyl hydrolase [Legionella wadsworthii]STY29185.1 Glycosyl hydrolase family 81 [Legionella wadsworthii]
MTWKNRKNNINTKKIFLTTTAIFLFSSNTIHSATQIGKGIYYDEQQIQKLAQKYPGRVSKDAGYPLINNYSTLKSAYKGSQFGLGNKPITTGLWWTPMLAVDKPSGQIQDSDYLNPLLLIPNPLTVRLTEKGISLGIPLQNAKVDNVHVDRGYDNTLDVTVTTGDLMGTAPLVADYSDWMVSVAWARNNEPLLAASVVEGSPFVFVEKKSNQTTSYLQFNNSQEAKLLSQDKGISLFKTKNASDTAYRYYAYFSNPDTAIIPWKTSTGTIIVPISQGGSGTIVPSTTINTAEMNRYFSLAVIPASSDSSAMEVANQFKPYASTFIKNTSITYEYDKSKAKVVTHFNFDSQTVYSNASLKQQPLVLLYPWQIKNLNSTERASCLFNDDCASNKGIIQTLKGTMHPYVVATGSAGRSSFSTEVDFHGVLPILPNRLSQTELDKIASYSFELPPDPHLDAKNPWTDTYATGKLLSREAQLIKIADVLMGTSPVNPQYKKIRDDLLLDLKNQVTSFLTGLNYTDPCPGGASDCPRPEGSWFYAYNNQWDTMMGFPSGFFTATTLTDHAFHWGYLLDGAATIAQFDKEWAREYGGMVNLLIRDVCNFKYGQEQEVTKFPHFRSFDPYAGLSSALGMPYSFDNVNEEDSAEFMNLAQAIILWGLNTEGVTFDGDNTTPQEVMETGLYLYTTEEQGLNHYHFNQNPGSGVFPTGWSNSSTGQNYLLVGNVWGGKLDRSTYFCAGQPCYYQNLASNTLPINAGSFYLGYDPGFVNRVYNEDAKNPCSGDPANSAYCGTLLKYLALGDAAKALQYYTQYFDVQGKTPDPGESKPSIYYWIQNLKNLGSLNTALKADTPSYGVFGSGDKTYVVAYNNEPTAKQVNFYNQDSLICSLENIQPGEIKGSICGKEDPPPPETQFSYMLYVGYPFKPVLINNSITCPDPVTKNPACLIKNIAGPSVMTIAGNNSNMCTLSISKDGVVTVMGERSKGCYINSTPATPSKAGSINLPGNF